MNIAARPAGYTLARVELVVPDPDRAARWFADVLQFAALPAAGRHGRQAMQLGDEIIVLVAAASAPSTATNLGSDDPRFQHLAIVVSDIEAAWRRLLDHRVATISPRPQTLPPWNREVAGIRAAYFRAFAGRTLELIKFPADKGLTKWHGRDGRLFLGIDHTAIVVRDTAASLHFYRGTFGLAVTGTSLNHGIEQGLLTGLPGARVKVTSLRGRAGPGVELLEYLRPATSGDDRTSRAGVGHEPRWRMRFAPDARNDIGGSRQASYAAAPSNVHCDLPSNRAKSRSNDTRCSPC